MDSIYDLMKKDWKAYCLMSGIALIEEMQKPTITLLKKNYKEKITVYKCFHPLRLKMKNQDTLKAWLQITKKWQKELKIKLLGTSEIIKFDEKTVQGHFYFSPRWIYEILKVVKSFPSQHVNEVCFERIKNYRKSNGQKIFREEEIQEMIDSKSLYSLLLENKKLASGAFIVSFDLEFRGIQDGRPNLVMSEKYKDFLEFMLSVANKWNWSTSSGLKPVNVKYSLNHGINASPQFGFHLKSRKLEEIYELAGPVIDKEKDKCLAFNIKRMKMNKINGKPGKTKQKLIKALEKLGQSTTTELQFFVYVGIDVLNLHLNQLLEKGLVIKKRYGKRYVWRLANAS